jgi:beta-galactosidase
VEGEAFIAGVDNGSPISMERFKDNQRKAFYGKCLVVLQNNGKKGNITLKALSDGLQGTEIKINAK